MSATKNSQRPSFEVLEAEAKWGIRTGEFSQTAVLKNSDIEKLPAIYKARSEEIKGTDFSLNTEVAKDLIFGLLNFKMWSEEVGETAASLFTESGSSWRGKKQVRVLAGTDEANENKFKKWFYCLLHDTYTEKDSSQKSQLRKPLEKLEQSRDCSAGVYYLQTVRG